MDTRSIGSLTVGVVGLGCNNFGMRIGRKETAAVVGAALDAGITLFDTADIYGGTKSESYLGAALGTRRDEIVLATKFGVPYEGHEGGAGAAYIRTAVEDSNPLASIDQPSRSVGYVDSFLPWLDDVAGYYVYCRLGRTLFCWDYGASECKPSTCSNVRTDWHNEGVNAVYLDGHARWSKLSQLTYSQFLVGPQFGLAPTDKRYNCPISVWPKSCNNPAQ